MITLYSSLVLNHYIDRRIVENLEDRKDITSRVFQTVFRQIESQGFERQGRGAFRGWLKITTKNKVGDFIRRERRRKGKSSVIAATARLLSADAGAGGSEQSDEKSSGPCWSGRRSRWSGPSSSRRRTRWPACN